MSARPVHAEKCPIGHENLNEEHNRKRKRPPNVSVVEASLISVARSRIAFPRIPVKSLGAVLVSRFLLPSER